jgi:hypothetical protein
MLTFSAPASYCYETLILHYPDRNWIPVAYDRLEEEEEVIAKFVPIYDDKKNWTEMLVFHSYKQAKKDNETADEFIQTVLGRGAVNFSEIKKETIKTDPNDSVIIWYGAKGKEPAQYEILRVTVGIESVISVHYINRDIRNFPARRKIWLPIIENATVYYSYYRWDRMMNKALCVEL